MYHAVTSKPIAVKCTKACHKMPYCRLKYRQNGCEYQTTCHDCIYKLVDEYSGEVYCNDRMVSDRDGQGDIKICEKFREVKKR